MLKNVLLILAGALILSFLARSKNQKQLNINRTNLQIGNLNERQIMNIYRKLDTYRDSTFYAVIAYGIFFKQYFKDATENHALFQAQMHKQDLFKTYQR